MKNLKIVIPYVIVVLLLLILGGSGYYIRELTKKLDEERKFRSALIDSVGVYRNSNNELVKEKLTLQADLTTLSKMNGLLNRNQQEMLKRIKEIEKNNAIIAAALIKTEAKIDSIRQGKITIDTAQNTIAISDSLPDIKYNFVISQVRPLVPGVEPTFKIKELSLPNTQFIEFHWKDNKKLGYPVTFSVSNSNKYFETYNVDNYMIPEIQKEMVKPNFWQKLANLGKEGGKYLVGIGVGAGALLLLK